MQASGVLVGQVLLVLGIVLLGTWGATQYVAFALTYQPQLGLPWLFLADTPIYYPWQLFHWWYFFDVYAPHVFLTGGVIAAGSSLVAVGFAIAASVWRSRQSQLVTTYGSARWATELEIEQAGLTGSAGVFLGKLESSVSARRSGILRWRLIVSWMCCASKVWCRRPSCWRAMARCCERANLYSQVC